MYHVIGRPRNSSVSQTQYRPNYLATTVATPVERGHDKCKKKREIFVHKPEEEIYYEPYMASLQQEYSELSIECDSKVELPWKDIALPRTEMKIRRQVKMPMTEKKEETSAVDPNTETITVTLKEKKSTGTMELPWEDLIISDVIDVYTSQNKSESSSDSLEIPWADLALERPGQIMPLPEPETCPKEDIEIPWDEILIPNNIVIEPRIKRKYPLSNVKRHCNNDRPHNICTSNCQCDKNKKIRSPTAVPMGKKTKKVSVE